VFTIADSEAAEKLGVRTSFGESTELRYDVLGEFAELAAPGRFSVPIATHVRLDEWRKALDLSRTGRSHESSCSCSTD
jgi:hypothetical protein